MPDAIPRLLHPIRRMMHSLAGRLTVLFCGAALLVLVVLGMAVTRSIEQHFMDEDKDIIAMKLLYLQSRFSTVHTEQDLKNLYRELEKEMASSHGLALRVTGVDGQVLFATPGIQFPADMASDLTAKPGMNHSGTVYPSDFSGLLTWYGDETLFRSMSAPFKTAYAPQPAGTVAVGLNIAHHEMFLNFFKHSMWISIAIAALIMGLLSWVTVRQGLLPLRRLIASASQVTASQLDRRLPTDSAPSEVAELAHSLNTMLARLEGTFKRLSDFSSDLAHELRTPISNLKTQTQVVLSRERSADEYRDVLYSNAEELDHLTRMVSDMLFLAKADNGILLSGAKEIIALDAEVSSLFEFYEVLADVKNITLESSGQAHIRGNRLMLRRALSNLISNAIAYSHHGTAVKVDIKEEVPTADRIVPVIYLSVQSSGGTIPPEHLPRLFDRFYRVDSSRHSLSNGSGSDSAGLGLAITHSIVQAHGGDITVHSADGVTRFEVVLPTITVGQ